MKEKNNEIYSDSQVFKLGSLSSRIEKKEGYFFKEYIQGVEVVSDYEEVKENDVPISRKNKSQGLSRMDEFKQRLREQEKSKRNNWND